MLELILRIGFSLLVVFGLMWALARLVKRPLTGRGGAVLGVLARQQLGRSSAVAVVRVVDRALVLGVTDAQVTLLAETDLATLQAQLAGPEPAARKTAVSSLPGGAAVGTPPESGLDDVVRLAAPATGRLHGSVLSPATWRQVVDFLRERTARR